MLAWPRLSLNKRSSLYRLQMHRLGQFVCLSVAVLVNFAGAQVQPATAAKASGAAPAHDERVIAAEKQMQLGHFDEAVAALQKLETADPKPRGLAKDLGVAYYKKGDYLDASRYLHAAIDEDTNDNEAVQLLGLSYYLSGKPQDAIPLLEKVQTWFASANVDASYILGICYIQSKDYPHARGAFARMFGVETDSAAAYLFTARMLLRQEFDPIAEEYAQKAIALDPKLPLAHQLLGELHLYKSRVPEAIEDFTQELQLNPSYAPAYYKLADAYSRVQKYDEAERLIQRSIWLDSTSTGPYILLGKVLEKKGEPLLALRSLQRAAAMDPNNPITHHLLGQAQKDLGNAADADRELKLAEELQNAQNATH